MNELLTPALIGIATTAFMIIVLLAIFGKSEDVPAHLKKRMERVTRSLQVTTKQTKMAIGSQTLRRSTTDSAIPWFDSFIKSALPNPDKLRARLMRTGKTIAIGEYLLINAVMIVIFFLVFAFLVKWSTTSSVFMGITVGLWLPHKIINRMGNKRVTAFLASFPEAIDTICRGLRSGLPVAESIAAVGTEMADPIGLEFRRVSDSVRMGRSMEESMWEVSSRLDTPEFRFFIIALSIQKETGGNLAETLGNLGDLLRKRRQLRMKIKAMSSEARASAMIIGSLPFLMFTLLYFVNPDYIRMLTHDPRGNVLLTVGCGWLSLGIFVMKQMISFEL